MNCSSKKSRLVSTLLLVLLMMYPSTMSPKGTTATERVQFVNSVEGISNEDVPASLSLQSARSSLANDPGCPHITPPSQLDIIIGPRYSSPKRQPLDL